MTTLQLLIVCGTAIALALIALVARLAVAGGDTEHSLEPGTAVGIRTVTGATIRGIVDDDDGSSTVLREGAILAIGGQEQPLGGQIRVPAKSVDWIQEL